MSWMGFLTGLQPIHSDEPLQMLKLLNMKSWLSGFHIISDKKHTKIHKTY